MSAIVSYEIGGMERVGLLDGATIRPLPGVSRIDADVDLTALADPADGATANGLATVDLASVTLLPASPHARRIICVGLNYQGHVNETKRELPTYPVLFAKFASNLLAANDDIRLPAESTQVDWEGELAVVIGKAGRRIAEENALEHVLGFSVANDISMRDFQYKTHQWIQGKAWDESTPLGPAIVRPADVDLSHARITTFLNGDIVQDSDLSKLIFSIPRLIAEISTFTALEAGDVILTGTPGGVGYRRDPQRFLVDGDVVAVEIEGVGRVENRVVA